MSIKKEITALVVLVFSIVAIFYFLPCIKDSYTIYDRIDYVSNQIFGHPIVDSRKLVSKIGSDGEVRAFILQMAYFVGNVSLFEELWDPYLHKIFINNILMETLGNEVIYFVRESRAYNSIISMEDLDKISASRKIPVNQDEQNEITLFLLSKAQFSTTVNFAAKYQNRPVFDFLVEQKLVTQEEVDNLRLHNQNC